jgi:ketosteroid isomerase-like protein
MEPVNGPLEISEQIAAAIARRDTAALRRLLSDDFLYRAPGGPSSTADAFLRGIEEIPGEINFVRLESLQMDVVHDRAALVTGIQHARVTIDGQVIDDRRAFVDLFELTADGWRIRTAVDLPGSSANG